jgi:hypothetical protein
MSGRSPTHRLIRLTARVLRLIADLIADGETRTAHRVTVAIEADGIMLACRGGSTFFSASEARDIVSWVEQVAASEN